MIIFNIKLRLSYNYVGLYYVYSSSSSSIISTGY